VIFIEYVELYGMLISILVDPILIWGLSLLFTVLISKLLSIKSPNNTKIKKLYKKTKQLLIYSILLIANFSLLLITVSTFPIGYLILGDVQGWDALSLIGIALLAAMIIPILNLIVTKRLLNKQKDLKGYLIFNFFICMFLTFCMLYFGTYIEGISEHAEFMYSRPALLALINIGFAKVIEFVDKRIV
jgi:hypothetical protein